jgi:hypothetical protein
MPNRAPRPRHLVGVTADDEPYRHLRHDLLAVRQELGDAEQRRDPNRHGLSGSEIVLSVEAVENPPSPLIGEGTNSPTLSYHALSGPAAV